MTPREPATARPGHSFHGGSAGGNSRVQYGDHNGDNYNVGPQREQSHFQRLPSKERDELFLEAASEGQYRRLCLLIDADANLDHKNENGQTALHLASYQAHVDCIEVLIDKGANINAIDNNGKQPIDEATASGIQTAIQALLKAGAGNRKNPVRKSTQLQRPSHQPTSGDQGGSSPVSNDLDVQQERTSTSSRSVVSLDKRFERLLADFKKKLRPEEVTRFESTTFADLQRTILSIQEEQRRTKTVQNLKRIEAFLTAMTQFKDVIGEFLDASHHILSFIWGPIKYMLSTASHWGTAFDVILDTYKRIGEDFPLLMRYKQMFKENDQMKRVLVWIYEDILKIHDRALRLFSQPAWRTLFSATWKDFQESLKPILDNLVRHRDLIDNTASHEQIQEIHEQCMRSHASFASNELEQQRVKTLAVVNWLSAADAQMDHETFLATTQEIPGSGKWIFEEECVTDWLDTNKSNEPMLWVYGKPGAGKTILASIIIDQCSKIVQTMGNISLAYFYCKDEDSQRNKFVAVAKSMLGQLLSQNPTLLPYLYEECLKSAKATLQSQPQCMALLKTSLEVAPQTILVIDGIDECEPKDRKAILNFFTSIITERSDGKIRALFVSQELSDIKSALSMAGPIKLSKGRNELDITKFAIERAAKIQQRFDQMPNDARDYIVRLVCDGAEGMFLFAKLVLENLYDQGNLEDVYKELQPDIFPKGFNQAYARIVNRIFKNPNLTQRKIAQSLIGWIAFSKRPLKWHEIQGAACIDVEQQDVNFKLRQIPDHVRDICGSLVEVLPGDRVQLVHSTAKSYLIQDKCLDTKKEEARLAILCMRYLTFPCFDHDISEEDLLKFTNEGSYSFLDYASLHWLHHLESLLPFIVPEDITNSTELGMAINEFYEMDNPIPEDGGGDAAHHSEDKLYRDYMERCKKLQDADCCETIVLLLSHAKGRRLADEKIEALQGLGETMNKFRASLVGLKSKPISGSDATELLQFYGEKWYKCSRHACYYFHEGFANERGLSQHIDRHEKPFCCTEMRCTRADIGWSTEKELKKHMNQYHPDPETFSWKFPHIKKPPASFPCDACDKIYSRASSLKTHKSRTHDKERPFACAVCQKTFVRKYEMERHGKTHEKTTAKEGKAQLREGKASDRDIGELG